ncbi:L,D-transpeptidase family protein [Mailhella sp.]|uniref:L,D-transpeptidase family protein n=1 Tax=Mailhella sp. TaxID=1981029 RepID=UPI004063E7BF
MFRILLPLALLAFLLPSSVLADDWAACTAPHAPKFFYAADKARKLLFQLEERGGAPAIVREFACIHGRKEGDKQKEGDLKTPEGVYFITCKITQKLDFMEYGPHAFALNYPNPADRLRGKTGGGIWLHSKGQPIDGITTRGCLAIDKQEITELVPLLRPGTPVVVAERMIGAPFYDDCGQAAKAGMDKSALPAHAAPPPSPVKAEEDRTAKGVSAPAADAGPAVISAPLSSCVHAVTLPEAPMPAFCTGQTLEASLIRQLSMNWIERREQRAESLFDMYDAKAWPKASREAFAKKKERMRTYFRVQQDFSIDREALAILQGPGYWVSCFPERYTLKDGRRRGLRVLYWMMDDKGSYRVIGEAFIRP